MSSPPSTTASPPQQPPQPPPPPQQQPQPPPIATVALPAVAAPRKFPAPCWSHDETLALINSYQDKWYSLRRRNLRTADWDAVADEVTRRCPDQTPPKTSAQCRHKMEKLRKRYRTEKQRILSLPNHGSNSRFFGSSWVFFDLMDALELGSNASTLSTIALANNANNNNINNNVSHVSNNVSSHVSNVSSSNNYNHNHNHQMVSNVGRVDLEVKPFSMNHHVSANETKKGDLGKYFDEIMLGSGGGSSNVSVSRGKTSQNHDFDVRSAPPHIKIKVKNQHHHNQQQHGRDGYGGGGEVSNDYDEVDEYVGSGGGYKRKLGNYDEMYLTRKDGGTREGGSVVGEMVASIKMLGEGLVKMEKMKMEMMRDIEKMRMEMEMKRSEMILESQHLIINAFVEGLKKNKKVKVAQIE